MIPLIMRRHLPKAFESKTVSGVQRSFLFARGARSIQAKTEQDIHDVEEEDSTPVLNDSNIASKLVEKPNIVTKDSNVNYKAISNLKTSTRHDLAMIFTCKVCETRSVKTVCRESYEKGVVVARCGGCNNLHLIADHLGWFGEPGSVEDLLAARGEEVKKGSIDTLNFTLEYLIGTKSL